MDEDLPEGTRAEGMQAVSQPQPTEYELKLAAELFRALPVSKAWTLHLAEALAAYRELLAKGEKT